ncbi:hypothetical protein C8A05DRAFT_13798 [Staphylotrichum tortipilum]|uniref:PSI domain-containing protein n=1 Tax=Staphylotrichum tortipilum TaxID=2831512 RepID=A0AAN6RVI6_9PEZI|nr:hypothetical protein C8A05DRAFT_13798 [Staphylotrichum longicolle]
MPSPHHPSVPDEHFRRCWRQQFCSNCLSEPSCSWCPFTQACVPNTHPIPLLAPAYDEHVCPHWTERWEVRTRPLGCHVSTITALSVLVSVASTLVVLGVLGVVVACCRRVSARGRGGGGVPPAEGGWRGLGTGWRVVVEGRAVEGRGREGEPLLGGSGS